VGEIGFDLDNDGTLDTNVDLKFNETDSSNAAEDAIDSRWDGTGWDPVWDGSGFNTASASDLGNSNYITFEFSIDLTDVFGVSPLYDKTVGMCIHVYDDDTSSDYYWGGSSIDDASDWGELSLPEFSEIIIPIMGLVALFVIFKRKKKKTDN
jgi:hypothetical protein